MLEQVKEVVNNDNLDVCIVDARFIKPLDKDIIKYISNLDVPIIIYEESSLLGGKYVNEEAYVKKYLPDVNSDLSKLGDSIVNPLFKRALLYLFISDKFCITLS